LIAVSEQSSLLSHIKRIINHLETFGRLFPSGELSIEHQILFLSFGDYFLHIITEALKQDFKNSSYKDSRELIKTNSNFRKGRKFQSDKSINCQFFLLRMKVKLS
jgi:aspartokinase/homoserine dehydrogenase 1